MALLKRLLGYLVATAVLGGLAAGGYFTRDRWMPLLSGGKSEEAAKEAAHDEHAHGDRVKLTPQARRNLGLVVKPVKVEKVYWRRLMVPGVVVDRPGQSDRGVTVPITGVVTKIHAFPSDTVRPGDALFDLRITSEFVQNTQAELFKTAKEVLLQEKVVKQLQTASDVVPAARVVEAQNQLSKLVTQAQSHRQILQTSGLTPAQIDEAAAGRFVKQVTVAAPPPVGEGRLASGASTANAGDGAAYEVQDLKAQLGEQVQAGQVLGTLASHQLLYIEGRGFKSEAGALARAAENGWAVEAEFAEDDATAWPDLKQTLTIRHLANAMDTSSRTFGFFLSLVNQSRSYRKDGKVFQVWRFRPGQRVRLHVPVEQIKGDPVEGKPDEFTGVLVLPRAALVREGPDAYVFRANGDAFDRKPVRLLYEDRLNVVLANDGSVAPGLFVAQNAAAALNRVVKAQQAAEAGGGGHEGHNH